MNMKYGVQSILLSLCLLSGLVHAAGDKAINLKKATSLKLGDNDDKLFLKQVTEGVYAIVGPLGNRSPKNFGNNATFGFIVTADGIVLVDPGGSYNGAKRIHEVIRTVSDKDIKYVINTGGQDHRWLGNDYFKQRGAKVIASKDAVKDQKARSRDILMRLMNAAGEEAVAGTEEQHADIEFDNQYTLTLGKTTIQIHHPGGAHSPGDSFVWLPKQQVVFSGDIVYSDRLLSLMAVSNSKSWVNAYEQMAALKPIHVIPGHGNPTTLAIANRDTYGYLKDMRLKVAEFMDKGGVIEDVGKIDQSQYRYLKNFDLLKGRNIQQLYQEIEWE